MKSLDHFLPSFLSKNGNFKTRDFRPLIKRFIAGVVRDIKKNETRNSPIYESKVLQKIF